MDFVGVDGLGFLGTSETGFSCSGFEFESKQKDNGFGSGCLKQGRSGSDEEWRSFKMARREDYSASKAMVAQQQRPTLLRSNSLYPDAQFAYSLSRTESGQLCYSSLSRTENGQLGYSSLSKTDNGGAFFSSDGISTTTPALPFYQSTPYTKNTGLISGSSNGNMHGVMTGVRGPFTPSQWIELEHQALIFKHLTTGAPIPANLLISLRKTLNPSGFPSYSAGSLRPNSLGWGSFHLGFSGNSDPEPGRCRRTDGKKWRCSRDAVADQKYCERHMNRGRHRSRKPVEGHTNGHASSSLPKTITTNSTTTSTTMAKSLTSSLNVTVSNGGGSSLAVVNQMKSLPVSESSLPASQFDRFMINKAKFDEHQGLSMVSSIGLRPKAPSFPLPKQNLPSDFGLISSKNLLNPSRNSYLHSRNFIDGWPKTCSEPEERTQLSISIPVASSDFSSSSSSPTQESASLSPLKLSRDVDLFQMGLGVGPLNETCNRQANLLPISWETSMGGPLAEVLNSTNNPKDCKSNSSSALNLMGESWEMSPRMGSSPTGVLQKAFGSLSNSSTGSSPRAENKAQHESTSLCDDLFVSTFVNSSSIPSL
ncbi:hypothetical protein AMTRI_Chr12g272470 [Amborella trichopoda]|uniref:growth-regulating factor 6 n=1 Tax=Amborella trichopoda TaxID=13333 RepID=UPI0009BD5129|nr:growth-regulating factor 6 [Amborella trichopoda]|eukprot:XP_011628017.2 growth-regulating factor 6 [Amborella trichopoda]